MALAEFTYNNSIHSTTKTTPFYALYGYNPTLRINTEVDVPGGEAPSAQERVRQLAAEREMLTAHWESAMRAQEKYYNKKHTPRRFAIGGEVMLAAKNLRQVRPSKKLADRYLGPFKITAAIGEHGQAYKLELPASYKIHPVFHVGLLEPYQRRDGDTTTTPESIDVGGEDHWVVESIIDHRVSRKLGAAREYLVRWKGFPLEEASWVAHDDFGDGDMVEAYDAQYPHGPSATEARKKRGRPPKKKRKV